MCPHSGLGYLIAVVKPILLVASNTGTTAELKGHVMKQKVIALVASAAIALTSISSVAAQTASAPASETVSDVWVPASQAEQDAARGGAAPIAALLYIGGTWVIRQCLVRAQACVNGAVATFNSVSAARKYACKKYRRFC